MELKTAIEILEYHQQWRLGKKEDMIHEPKKLTKALDMVILEVKKISLGMETAFAVIPDSERLDNCSGCDWIDIDYKVRKCVKCSKTEQFD